MNPPNVPKTVKAWVADAEATYGPTFETWFLAEFDWKALCADVPAMAERVGQAWTSATAAAAKARLEETAQQAFRGGYVAALALMAAFDAELSPDDALTRLCAPPAGDEQDALAETLDADLAAVERLLAGPASTFEEPSARVVVAARASRAVRGTVRALLTEGLARAAEVLVGLGARQEPLAKVLSGVVTVAVALAGLRYAVAVEVDEATGGDPLRLDLLGMRSALGDLADA